LTVLYVANSTKQNTVYAYRAGFADPNSPTPPNFRLVSVPCPAGGQIKLFEGSIDAVSGIILQLLQQGATDVADLDRRQTDLIHAVFSTDTPVNMMKVRTIIARNDELMNDQAFLKRKQLAVATHYKMNERAQEFGPDSPRPHNVIMETTEIGKLGEEGNTETIEAATPGHEPVARRRTAGKRK
jgi:hypothetical protein